MKKAILEILMLGIPMVVRAVKKRLKERKNKQRVEAMQKLDECAEIERLKERASASAAAQSRNGGKI